MCSVSFLPNSEGFDLLMNRDEQLSRTAALPPAIRRCGGCRAIYPHERGGGTWIGLNEAGLTLALINWYSQPQRTGPGTLSRGGVIPALLAAESAAEAECGLMEIPLARFNPFRLMVISQSEKSIQEWRSNGTLLEGASLPWEKRHWFSSGFDEDKANQIRGLTCRRAAAESDANTLPWLRRLHRSHHPTKGAFSLCMHRVDACTVSCTEISVTRDEALMAYHAGPPCRRGPHFFRRLSLGVNKSRVPA